jgi:Mrp family chromosome partitioning ATPase/capsular polysaccharide biosynthesis protein
MNFIPATLDRLAPRSTNAVNGPLAQIWRRRRVFGLVFLLVLLPALASILLLSPVYYAAGSVVIGNQEPASSSASAAWIEKLGDPADLESQLQIIQSRRMLRLALARPGVIDAAVEECRHRAGVAALSGRGENCARLTPNSQELVDHVEARYSVKGVGRSRIISIGYQSALPDVAFVMANALIVTYLEDQRAENARAREVTAAWLLKEGKPEAAATPAEAASAAGGTDGSAVQSRQKFYQDLYSKAADIESERRVLLGGGRLVSLAELPKFPYFPKRTPLAAAALTLALMLAMLAALRVDVTDGSVRRTQELEAETLVPVMGVLPCIEPAVNDAELPLGKRLERAVGERIAALTGAAGPAPESETPDGSAQALYTRLVLAGAGKTPRGILIGSAMPGEGKTFTTMALAKCAAESGRKVLVIDCNLRHPALAAELGLFPAAGLAEILRGEIEPERAVVQTGQTGISLIGSGAVRGGAATLLMDGGMQKLMSWAERYDLVLLDGPAAASFPDAGILAQSAGGVLWCVQWGRAQVSDVKAALAGISGPGVRVLGFAVTQARPEEMRFYERPRLFGSGYERRK